MSACAAVMSQSPAFFQQTKHAREAKNSLIQQYHIKGNENNEIHRASYGNLNRTEKLSSAVREAVERTGAYQLAAVERNAREERSQTLHVKSDEARQDAANFVNVLLGSKENRITQAKEVSEQKILGLKTAIDYEFELLDNTATEARKAVLDLRLQTATEALDLMDTATQNNGAVLGKVEAYVRNVELEQLAAQHGNEKDNTLLALQLERTQADTNRRLVLDRARNDERVEAVTAAATLQEADARTKVLLYEIETSAATARAAYEAKQVLRTTTAQTEQAVAASGAATTRDALLLARAEAAMYRSKR
jgi:hypothetical protein